MVDFPLSKLLVMEIRFLHLVNAVLFKFFSERVHSIEGYFAVLRFQIVFFQSKNLKMVFVSGMTYLITWILQYKQKYFFKSVQSMISNCTLDDFDVEFSTKRF